MLLVLVQTQKVLKQYHHGLTGHMMLYKYFPAGSGWIRDNLGTGSTGTGPLNGQLV